MKDFLLQSSHGSSLVISMVGSARESNMRSKLFRTVRQALHKISKSTGERSVLASLRPTRCLSSDLWLLTEGVDSSLTKMSDEIIRSNCDPFRTIHLIVSAAGGMRMLTEKQENSTSVHRSMDGSRRPHYRHESSFESNPCFRPRLSIHYQKNPLSR